MEIINFYENSFNSKKVKTFYLKYIPFEIYLKDCSPPYMCMATKKDCSPPYMCMATKKDCSPPYMCMATKKDCSPPYMGMATKKD